MPLKFTAVCELFQTLEDIITRDPPYLPAMKDKKLRQTAQQWFRTHRKTIDNDGNHLAVLSTLFPERRIDRVYGMQSKTLEKLVARCLIFGEEKHRQLSRWRERDGGDLGECVAQIEKDFDCVPLPSGGLMVEDVDAGLTELAARCRFSGPDVMKKVSAAVPDQIIKPLFYKMHSREKKWFIRLILKSLGHLQSDWNRIEALLVHEFHFLLSLLLRSKDDLIEAAKLLCGDLKKYPAQPDFQSRQIFLEEAEAMIVRPQIGIKVGRPNWAKARSFKNCLSMVGQGQWIIERKYDGEFVELHVDMSKGHRNCIKIFSKNGRDSTQDRRELHKTLRECLRIGQDDCKFKERCILLGEMVVWSDLEQKVMGFEKLRKYVSRAGSFLGTEKDSQPHPFKHLMIVFFDVLMVDDEITMTKPHEERRNRLSSLLAKIPGRASTAEWKLLDFATKQAQKSLVIQFTAALVQRCEGLVLKPNTSFFSLGPARANSGFRGFIKLKKDYMADMGGERDVADFAVVGASYDVKEAQKSGQKRLRWTNFYLGCKMDNEQAKYHSRPKFKVVAVIKQDQCIPPKDLQFLNQHGQFRETAYDPDGIDAFDIQLGHNPTPSVLFRDPFVVEVLGSAFEKPAGEDFWMLRHPRVIKIHTDRTWEDCITVSALAQMADEARTAPADGDSQEVRRLVEKLYGKMQRADERERSQNTLRSSTTESPTTAVRRGIHINQAASPTQMPAVQTKAGQLDHPSARPSVALAQHCSPEPCPNPSTFGAIHTISGEESGRESANTQLSTHFTQTIVSPRSSQAILWPRVEISPPKRRASNAVQTRDRMQQPHAPIDHIRPLSVPRPRQAYPTEKQATTFMPNHARSTIAEQTPCKIPAGCLQTPTSVARTPTKATERLSRLKINHPSHAHAAPEITVVDVQQLRTAGGGRSKQPRSLSKAAVPPRKQLAMSRQSAGSPGRSGLLPTPKSTPDNPASSREQVPTTATPLTPAATPRPPAIQNAIPPTPRPSSRKENDAPPFLTGISAPAKDNQGQPSRLNTTKPLQPLPVLSNLPELPTTRSLKRMRTAVDDFDIDMVPRKIPRWGRPSLLLKDDATSKRPSSSSGLEVKPAAKPPLNLPYALPATAILLPHPLHANPMLQNALNDLDASGTHVGALTTDLSHWRRDATVYEPMGPVVGESQAWDEAQGWNRCVLVDQDEDHASRKAAFVRQVRDVVGDAAIGTAVFDWRVLRDLQSKGYGLGVGGEEEARVWRHRFCGRV
ncbi:hypothetical protein HDK90DRAFT_493541 [Phyllosticta capitalensis]|uniref:ATP-dependent DNA ligase family profile domain-containing protein n=2 Tax=Phyllosticta capitalensis TaxID=121624 RepID=A0ABR1YGZ5_9PEZI